MYLNKVLIIGNLTKDPELKALPSGVKVASFSVATNKSYKKDGEKKDTVEYHNITSFGKQAELIVQYMKKGSQIYIEGRLQTRNWEDKETGKKVYKTEIIVENFQFGYNKNAKTASDGASGSAYDVPSEDEISSGLEGNSESTSDNVSPEDIPF